MSVLIQPNGLPVITPGEPMVTCQYCGHSQARVAVVENHYGCLNCNQMLCLTCGCSEYCPCADGCAWSGLGRCSACEAELMATVRELWPEVVVL